MSRSTRLTLALVAASMLVAGPAGCAALPAIASFFGAAAPVVTAAVDAYQARARELAPTLPVGDPRLDEIASRLASLEDTRRREQLAADSEGKATKTSDAVALVAALEEAVRAKAQAQRERDALAAALRAIPVVPPAAPPLPSSVLPAIDAVAPVPSAPLAAGTEAPPDAGAPQGTP
jgi:hypothetical protein